MRQSTPAPADEPNGPPPLIPADPETPKGRLVAAIWDEDVDAVGHVLDQNPNLASATLAHHGLLHRRWLGEVQRKEGFFLRDRSMLTEPAVIFAAKIPFYKNIYRSTRTISVESLAVLRLLVDRGASLRRLYPDPERWTKYGIFEACGQYDSPEAMNLLARAGAEVDIKRAWGPVGLGALALQYGAPRTLRALCDLGAAYVPFPDGLPGGSLEHFTPEPIVQAARSGHEDAIKVLLELLDHSQWTRQISHGFDFPLTVLDAVLLAATDVLVPRDDVDEPIEPNRPWLGQIPWVVRQERLVHLLLDAGANPGATDSAGRTAFQCACRWAGDALIRRFSHAVPGGVDQQLPYLDWHDKGSYERETIRTGEKVTFLHVAAGYHNAAAVSCLLDVGAQVLCDEYGRTPLHWCFLTRDDFVQAEVRTMASLTQGVRELYEMEHWEQQIMPWAPSVDVIATLLPAVEDLRGRDASGPSVLHLAAQTRHWEAMAVLITKGFNPATRDEHGLTIFHLMVTAPKPAVGDPEHRAYMLGLEFLREVLRDRPDIGLNGAGPNGLTALHEACDLGHVLMAQLFLTLGAEPNCRDGVGWTPLCCAVASPCQDRGDALERLSPAEATDRRDKALYMKDMLLDAGADPTLRTDSGLTAEDIEHDIATKLADCVSRYAEDLYD